MAVETSPIQACASGSTAEFEDYSNRFHELRSRLKSSSGESYAQFRSSLRPRYGLVWAQFLAGYAALALIGAALTLARGQTWVVQAFATVAGALLFGYFIAYLGLFLHAATHYELSADKPWNDRLANILVGALFGYPIEAYRKVHFQHHRLLGQPEDPERGYIAQFNARFLFESLTGLRFLRILFRSEGRQAGEPGPGTSRVFQMAGGFIHLSISGMAALCGLYPLAIAWPLGFVLVVPTVVAVRLVLEHRSEHAHRELDYNVVPHGAVTRLFGDGPLAQTFGGAGFNRHLLHHWEPQVPYTRLKELEQFLRTTELSPILVKRQDSYGQAFRRLFQVF